MKTSNSGARDRMARYVGSVLTSPTMTAIRGSSNASAPHFGSMSQPRTIVACAKYRAQSSSDPPFWTPISANAIGRSRNRLNAAS